MTKTRKIKKYAADKLALLGLFIIALLIARFITASKSTIKLSGLIKLNHTGLSVAMPAGNGWHSEEQWKYEKNSFTLNSLFALRPGHPVALASCRYSLAAAESFSDELFEQNVSEIGGVIVNTGQIQAAALVIDWAHIEKPQTLSSTCIGTTRLPDNRQLDIEVRQTAGDTELAQQAFDLIVEGLKFEDNQLLKAGSEIVAQIKYTGLNRFVDNQNQQNFFLITNARQQAIGFTMDVLIDSPQNAPLNIQAKELLYISGRRPRKQIVSFQSDNSFDEFVWKSEVSSRVGREETTITLDATGIMTVRQFSDSPQENRYQPGPAAIPEVFFEQLLSQTINSSWEKILVDIIDSHGEIVPAFIHRVEAEDAEGYILKIELLNNKDYSQLFYLDDGKRISKILSPQKGIILERATMEDILKQFPSQADYILRTSKMLGQN